MTHHSLVALAADGSVLGWGSFAVPASADAGSSDGSLASTGSTIGWTAPALAGGLLVTGALALLLIRRARRANDSLSE